MSAAITTENIGKRYRLGGLRPEHMSLRETLGDLLMTPFKKIKSGSQQQTLWALRDVISRFSRAS